MRSANHCGASRCGERLPKAASEISVAYTVAAESSLASVIGDAAGTGADIYEVTFSPLRRGWRPARISRTARRSRATSMRCSVSGRGMSTSGVTSNSRPQNSCLPVRCCVGTPEERRERRAK